MNSGAAELIRFSLRIDPEVRAKLIAQAEKQDRSLNWVVNDALAEYVNQSTASRSVIDQPSG